MDKLWLFSVVYNIVNWLVQMSYAITGAYILVLAKNLGNLCGHSLYGCIIVMCIAHWVYTAEAIYNWFSLLIFRAPSMEEKNVRTKVARLVVLLLFIWPCVAYFDMDASCVRTHKNRLADLYNLVLAEAVYFFVHISISVPLLAAAYIHTRVSPSVPLHNSSSGSLHTLHSLQISQ